METNSIKRILLVDDDPDILDFLSYNLKKEGYKVEAVNNGKEALKVADRFLPHLILLDVMMPEMDGIATCKELRANNKSKDTIIIFLTARIEEYSEIAGFSAGADDYITKPIKPGALLIRIKTIFMRANKDKKNESILKIGEIIIDRNSYSVMYRNKVLHFARKEFELIYLLASNPNIVFSRDDLLEKVWGNDVYVGERTIDVHIRKIREKINPDYIKTIKGVGYKFELNHY